MYETSISEEIAKVFTGIFNPKEFKFHSGGREDVDVRMLGGNFFYFN